MATSGTTSFFPPVDEIIEEAYDMLGGEPQLGHDPISARRSLNLLFIDMQNRGVPLFAQDQKTLSLVAEQESYTLDSDTVDILEVALRRTSNSVNTDTQLQRVSMEEYLIIPNKANQGRTAQVALDRQKTPVLYVWPAPETGTTDSILYWRVRRLEDVTASFQNVDWVYRYLPAITCGLAYYLAYKRFGIKTDKLNFLKVAYEEKMQMALEADRERVDMRVVPRLKMF
jgi:hypothetical protein